MRASLPRTSRASCKAVSGVFNTIASPSDEKGSTQPHRIINQRDRCPDHARCRGPTDSARTSHSAFDAIPSDAASGHSASAPAAQSESTLGNEGASSSSARHDRRTICRGVGHARRRAAAVIAISKRWGKRDTLETSAPVRPILVRWATSASRRRISRVVNTLSRCLLCLFVCSFVHSFAKGCSVVRHTSSLGAGESIRAQRHRSGRGACVHLGTCNDLCVQVTVVSGRRANRRGWRPCATVTRPPP